ncbi:hypothetical protein B0T16DRAFT_387498 [Cercophora newfieldiana]|uniref:Uncharacterized protein n=1 Tax=Cercophora newfieldiana TaxID=92897 RepID=A0AA40CUP9_9PEZI|nr:hypothetical protein B0T16DRAFT_387498 [Cercophora newfieldiana]
MTEPEQFIDDELFADLYDDETSQKPAAAPVAEQHSAVQQTTEVKQEFGDNAGLDQDYNGGDSHMNNDEYDDDDDDVDFNLGDGPVTAISHHEEKQASYNAPPPPPAQSKGPNAKEDGLAEVHALRRESTRVWDASWAAELAMDSQGNGALKRWT